MICSLCSRQGASGGRRSSQNRCSWPQAKHKQKAHHSQAKLVVRGEGLNKQNTTNSDNNNNNSRIWNDTGTGNSNTKNNSNSHANDTRTGTWLTIPVLKLIITNKEDKYTRNKDTHSRKKATRSTRRTDIAEHKGCSCAVTPWNLSGKDPSPKGQLRKRRVAFEGTFFGHFR